MKKPLIAMTLALAALALPGLAVAQPTEDLSRPVAVEIAAAAGVAVYAATELTKGAALVATAADTLPTGLCAMHGNKKDGKGKGGGGKKCLTAKAGPDDGDGGELHARGPGDDGGGESEPTSA